MKYIAILILLGCNACLAVNKTEDSDPVINGITVTNAPITEVNTPPKVLPPNPSPNTTSTSTTSTTTTTSSPTTHITKSTTTTTSEKPSTTPQPNPTTTNPNSTTAPGTTAIPPHHDRNFDGPSFIGGIILALGLVAIGFVAFKFYKARTESNYHTL